MIHPADNLTNGYSVSNCRQYRRRTRDTALLFGRRITQAGTTSQLRAGRTDHAYPYFRALPTVLTIALSAEDKISDFDATVAAGFAAPPPNQAATEVRKRKCTHSRRDKHTDISIGSRRHRYVSVTALAPLPAGTTIALVGAFPQSTAEKQH